MPFWNFFLFQASHHTYVGRFALDFSRAGPTHGIPLTCHSETCFDLPAHTAYIEGVNVDRVWSQVEKCDLSWSCCSPGILLCSDLDTGYTFGMLFQNLFKGFALLLKMVFCFWAGTEHVLDMPLFGILSCAISTHRTYVGHAFLEIFVVAGGMQISYRTGHIGFSASVRACYRACERHRFAA